MPSTDAFLHSLDSAPAGLSLGQLLALHPDVPRRTAQRRFGQMVASGQLQTQGAGRSRRYLKPASLAAAQRLADIVPLSADSRDILAYIEQPLTERKPVGCQADFLLAYQPNQTWYLPEGLRRQLHRMGRTTPAHAPAGTYSRAMLGVYEMTRVELLRDLYVWAYERSTQEYLAIRQERSEPDPLRLAWRDLIKTSIRRAVQHPEQDPLQPIQEAVAHEVPESDRDSVLALITEELHRLHEGVLARYGLRPSEWLAWRARQTWAPSP